MIKSGHLIRPSQSVSDDNLTPEDNQTFSKLSPSLVIKILGTMLCSEKQFLNDEALYQEGMGLYLLIEPVIPFQSYREVGMTLEIARSLVLRALRKSDNSLGVESAFDKLFLLWTRGS